MNSPYLNHGSAVLPFTAAADYSDKLGYGVTLAGDTATLGASATVVNRGVIVDGGTESGSTISVAVISGLSGTVRVRAGGAVARGDMLIQKNDGTWITDTGSGARVQSFMANEAGASGELIDAVPQTPLTLS
jgi:hypothetical protein